MHRISLTILAKKNIIIFVISWIADLIKIQNNFFCSGVMFSNDKIFVLDVSSTVAIVVDTDVNRERRQEVFVSVAELKQPDRSQVTTFKRRRRSKTKSR